MNDVKATGPSSGCVAIIGVGPGDPELLTVRALRTLLACDLVVHAGPADRSGFAYEIVKIKRSRRGMLR